MLAAKQAWIDAAVKSMTTLNKAAAEVITAGPTWSVHALTDITGFGLIGHAREMARASDVSLVFQSANIPVLEGALDCIHAGHIPGGLKANREFAECMVEYESGVPEDVKTLLFDPQTAGGLLISVAGDDSAALTRALRTAGIPAVEIGQVLPRTKPLIRVT